ncbi:MAG: efflux RND transporter periplasmic adaptor subunit [Vicinamibacterales bacterium]|nr:efflux RND transporter periplasmic adaptor subunit [Vicinamibacterales bacterium]
MTVPFTLTHSPRSPRRRTPIGFLAGVLAASVTVASCGGSPSPSAAGAPPEASSSAAAPVATDGMRLSAAAMRTGGVSVETARSERRAGYFETPAVLQLDETRTARVGSIVEGVVVNANVQVGARVGRDTRLADIHSHMVHEAWAEYRRAMAERRRAASELDYVKDAEARTSRLLATKAVSQQEAERARTDRGAAEQTLIIADSEIRRALDELEHLGITPDSAVENDPRDTVPVNAPLGGIVLERLVTAGTAVTTGTPLFVVSDLSRLWAVAEIDEARLPALTVGRAAQLEVVAYPGRSFPARIVAIGDSLNPDTRRITARIEVNNANGSLKPQMYATVRVPTGEEVQIVVVPATAVQKIEQQAVVFVERAAGVFSRRSVVIGPERDGLVEIREGLQPTDRIATTGTFLLKSKFLEGSQPE